jgi:hypothetical protein
MPSFDVIGLGALNVDRIYSVPRVVTDGAELIQEARRRGRQLGQHRTAWPSWACAAAS